MRRWSLEFVDEGMTSWMPMRRAKERQYPKVVPCVLKVFCDWLAFVQHRVGHQVVRWQIMSKVVGWSSFVQCHWPWAAFVRVSGWAKYNLSLWKNNKLWIAAVWPVDGEDRSHHAYGFIVWDWFFRSFEDLHYVWFVCGFIRGDARILLAIDSIAIYCIIIDRVCRYLAFFVVKIFGDALCYVVMHSSPRLYLRMHCTLWYCTLRRWELARNDLSWQGFWIIFARDFPLTRDDLCWHGFWIVCCVESFVDPNDLSWQGFRVMCCVRYVVD